LCFTAQYVVVWVSDVSSVRATTDPFWEAFRKVARLKVQLTGLARTRDDEELWQVLQVVNEIEGHLYEAIHQKSTRPVSGRD